MEGRKTHAIDRRGLLAAAVLAGFACSEHADPQPSSGSTTGDGSGGDGGTSCGPDCDTPDDETTSSDETTSGDTTTSGAVSTTGDESTSSQVSTTAPDTAVPASVAGSLGGAPGAGGAGGATMSTATTYMLCRNGGFDVEFCLTREQMETQARYGYSTEFPLDPPRSDEEIAEAWDEQGCLPQQWVGSACCKSAIEGPRRRGDQCCYTSCEGELLCCGQPPSTASTTG